MPKLDLIDEEHAALAKLLRETIDRDRFPLSPRLPPVKAVLARLQPPAPKPPLPEAAPAHGAAAGRQRRRR